MAYKKYREMKVYEASGYQYKRTPSIVLKGQWLSELGFDIGEQIVVKCEDGRLIITKANEIWSYKSHGKILKKSIKNDKIFGIFIILMSLIILMCNIPELINILSFGIRNY